MIIIAEKDVIISDIVSALSEGKTLVYPTETCYGLGCDATNPAAVKKVFALKGRAKEKSLIVIVHELSAMAPFIEIIPALRALAERYWPSFAKATPGKPGALTVIVPLSPYTERPHPTFPDRGGALAPGVVALDGTVAFRVTSHPFAHALCEAFGKPIVSTSANVSGGPNPYTIEEAVAADIGIDAGELPRRAPSTVVRLRGEKIEVIRQGEVVVSV